MEFDFDKDSIKPTSVNLKIDATGALVLPKGTTAQRSTPEYGGLRINTDYNSVEVYNSNNTTWNGFIWNGDVNTTNDLNLSLKGFSIVSDLSIQTTPTFSPWQGNILTWAADRGFTITTSGSVIGDINNSFGLTNDSYTQINNTTLPIVVTIAGSINSDTNVSVSRAFYYAHYPINCNLQVEIRKAGGTWVTIYNGAISLTSSQYWFSDPLTNYVTWPTDYPLLGIRYTITGMVEATSYIGGLGIYYANGFYIPYAPLKNPILIGTDSITIPSGSTAQRNATPVFGMVRGNSTTGTLEFYNGTSWASVSPSGSTDMPVVSVRRTTTFSATTTYTDVTFDTQDEENNTGVIEWVSGANVTVKEAGMYLITYNVGDNTSTAHTVNIRVRKNTATVITTYTDASAVDGMTPTFVATLAANDTLQLQISSGSGTVTVPVNISMTVVRLRMTSATAKAAGTNTGDIQYKLSSGDLGASTLLNYDTVNNSLRVGTPAITLTNPVIQCTDNINSYLQLVLQNTNSGVTASTDIICTADNGTDAINYIDMGIESSLNNDPNFTIAGANDGYLYVNGGNLCLGTDTTSKDVVFFSGGTLASNEMGRIKAGVGLLLTATDSRLVLTGITNEPAAPTSGNLNFYAKSIAGKVLPKFMGSDGIDFPVQSNIGFNRVFTISSGSGTTATTVFSAFQGGYTASASTYSQPTISSTNMLTQSRRSLLTSAAIAGALAYVRSSQGECLRGNSAGMGGFFVVFRFATETLQSGNRAFIGLWDTPTSAPTNVDPTTNTTPGKFGMAINANTGNWNFVHNITGSTPTVISLGANFPVNAAIMYELVLYAAPNASSINYRITNLSTNSNTSGVLTTNIPANTTILGTVAWITNNATLASVGLSISKIYLETDF